MWIVFNRRIIYYFAMPIIRPCLSKVVTETLLVSKVAISVAIATVPAANIVVKQSGHAESHRISTILLLFALAFLLRCL